MIEIKSQEIISLGGVILDVDDTLVASEGLTHEALRAAAREQGVELSTEMLSGLVGKNWRSVGDSLRRAIPDESRAAAVLDRCDALLLERLRIKTPERTAGADQLLDWIDEVHLPKAIASSADRAWVDLVLGETRHRFEVVVANEDVLEAKPSPEAFLVAAKRLGVAPSRCVVIGDSEADILGARQAGMTPIVVPASARISDGVLKVAHAVASSLSEVRDYLYEVWKRSHSGKGA